MSKNIEQCIRDGNKAFNNAVKIMLKPEMKRIAEMEEELLKRAVEMIRTDDSNIDLNADGNIELAKRILKKTMQDERLINDALAKSGLMEETKEQDKSNELK